MILLLDIGNSRIKSAMLSEQMIRPGTSAVHAEVGRLEGVLAEITPRPSAVYLVCVAGDAVAGQVDSWCLTHWGLKPVVLRSKSQCAGVTNAYTEPRTLGVDRWAAMIGAYHSVRGAVLVVDCGTVCTADLVDDLGVHRGGALLPGLRLMRESLSRGTAGVRRVAEEVETEVRLGTTTAECVDIGIRNGIIGFIEQMVQDSEALLGYEVTLMLTGGDALSLLQRLSRDACYEKELVFQGMTVMLTEAGDRRSS